MRISFGTVCVWALGAVLLAACGGGGGGGGDGTAATPAAVPPQPQQPMQPMPQDPASGAVSYGSYGAWNRSIRDTFPRMATCATAYICDGLLPALTGTIESPFGSTAAYDPVTDDWAATWSGEIEGYRHSDHDGDGPDGRHFMGTAKLKIVGTQTTHVRFWTERVYYQLADGSGRGTGSPGLNAMPDREGEALRIPLSTAAGEKGYFSGEGVHGQFAVPETGATVPPGAAGHLKRSGHTAVFEVRR